MGPNSKIAMVMRRHMHEYGTTLDHLGKIAVAGRYHASLNPAAYLRKPITIEDYKNSRLVADPVRLLDCVLPANGGKAYILASPERAKKLRKRPVYLKGFGERSNPSYGARAGSDALIMGVKDAGKVAMEMAGSKTWRYPFSRTLRRLHHRRLPADRRSRLLRQGRSRLFRPNRLHVQGTTADSNRRRHDQLRPAIHSRRNPPYSGSGAPAARRRRRPTSAKRQDWIGFWIRRSPLWQESWLLRGRGPGKRSVNIYG